MSNNISENAVDFIKATVAVGPSASVALFGISLEDWMFIVSIIASLFIILDKMPGIVERICDKFKKQSSDNSSSNPPDNPPG